MSVPRAQGDGRRLARFVGSPHGLLNLARSGIYRPGPVTGAERSGLEAADRRLHLKWPFYGSRRMVFELNQAGPAHRKRVQRLMRVIGESRRWFRAPAPAKPRPGHRIFPILRGVSITEPNHVWASDITISDGLAFCIWWRSSTGHSRAVWRGACRIRWIRDFCIVRSTKLWRGTARRKYSTPIRARSSPAPPSRRLEAAGIGFDGRPRSFHGQHFHRACGAR